MEMVVDYAASGNVCRIELPPIGPDREPGVKSARAVDEFLLELIPMATRGRELRRWMTTAGLHSSSAVQYENITVSEGFEGQTRTGVTVVFAKEECRDRPTQ